MKEANPIPRLRKALAVIEGLQASNKALDAKESKDEDVLWLLAYVAAQYSPEMRAAITTVQLIERAREIVAEANAKKPLFVRGSRHADIRTIKPSDLAAALGVAVAGCLALAAWLKRQS